VIQLTPLLEYPMHLQSMLHIRFSILPAYRTNACRCCRRLGPFPVLSCSTGPLLQASCRDPASVLPPGVPFLGEPCWSMLCLLGSTPRTDGRDDEQSDTHTHTQLPKHPHVHKHTDEFTSKSTGERNWKVEVVSFFSLFLHLDKLIVVNF
jgi:hypothetical protein